MRPLTEEETEKLFKKLATYIGDNVRLLLEREDGTYCFRLYLKSQIIELLCMIYMCGIKE